jgi:putative transposase
MLALISTLFLWLACRIRSRAELELELVALRHQVAVLNRQRAGRLRLCSLDRLVWVWLYRVWPRCLETMVLVKPRLWSNGTAKAFGSTGAGARGPGEGR